ncbi:hypothetical protein HPG69_001062 [Diceros bicornis minor]|uniref:Uncharacterized protein n=1 Tax=Diceros bicornis minor TaxID=77932 RepID=A0A7J7E5U0_DICBM|nr:hypothetical protein HPG69_001062 [Diceros bicornis minor]
MDFPTSAAAFYSFLLKFRCFHNGSEEVDCNLIKPDIMQQFWTSLHLVSEEVSSGEVGSENKQTNKHKVVTTIKNC